MTEKRERRCETCYKWVHFKWLIVHEDTGNSRFGGCADDYSLRARVPRPELTIQVTEYRDVCEHYTPIGLTIGVPDAEDLLLRIQNNYTEIEVQRERLNRLSTMLAEQQDKQPKPEPTSQCCENCVHWLDMWGATESELSSERLGGCSFRKSTKAVLHNSWMVEMPLVKMTETCEAHEWSSPPSKAGGKEPSNET